MEAGRSEGCREDKPRIRAFAWVALGAALFSLVLSIFASVALYADFDMNSVEIPGPHPVLGRLGGAALAVDMSLFVPCLVLAAIALFLGTWRPPKLKNGAVAFLALLLCLVTAGIRGATIDRVRGNPFRHRAIAAIRLRSVIKRYAGEHGGSLPPAATWCDALISTDPNAADFLAYPLASGASNGLSSLALNANLDGDMLVTFADDMVLLFETDPARNPVGGPAVLASYAEDKRGVVVVFGDLHIEFLQPQDLEYLHWAPAP